MKRIFSARLQLLLLISMTLAASAHARGTGSGREEDSIVSNGQGISSPSFWDGLKGENPAGLTQNTSLKLQGGLAAFNGRSDDSLRYSGGLLIGNGLLGAGIEYTTYNGQAFAAGSGQINWGIAGYLSSLSTSIGVSGHHVSGSNGGSYDLGAMIDLSSALRLGVLLPGINSGIDIIGAGITYHAGRQLDLVLDSSINLGSGGPNLMFKPGISVHFDSLMLTAAYGFGDGPGIVSKDLTAGIGLKVSRGLMLGYEYKGEPEHRLGLTLKLD